MIIAIDGHDGVGKTCLAKSLSEILNFKYVKYAAKELLNLSQEAYIALQDSTIAYNNSIFTAWFFAMSDMYALQRYKKQNIILDRSVLLNYYWNGNKNTKNIFDLSYNYFGAPDLVILLTASKQTRYQRLSKRNPNDKNLLSKKILNATNKKFKQYLKTYHINYVEIITDNLNQDQVLTRVLKELKKLRNM